MANLIDNVNRAIKDFDDIKDAITDKGIGVPDGTPTSLYAEKIRDIDVKAKGIFFEEVNEDGYPTVVNGLYFDKEILKGSFYNGPDGLYSLTTDIKLNSNVTNIGYSAFSNCTSLALTSLPSGITNIDDYAFQNCTSLALTSLPSGVISISNYAFQNCESLALTSLPSGITNISNSAFNNCPSLALTSLPSGITNIDDYAFFGCSSLALTSLPSGITNIGSYAFYDCKSLASIKFSGIPNTISSTAFHGCINLTDIYVPWSEGKVANAPWGTIYTTIHYNWSDDNAS